MRILFVHQNFPGQYLHLLRHFAADPKNEIVFLTRNANADFSGIRKIVYRLTREAGEKTHFYVRSIEQAVLHGQAVVRAAMQLKQQGFVPDVMLGHNAWGETLYLKDVFPQAPLLSYFEYFYRAKGGDLGFDPEFPVSADARLRLRTLNAVNLMGLEAADRGQTATQWQHSTYPVRYRDLITVAHEGIDTQRVKPDSAAVLTLTGGRSLKCGDEVVTYIARNLEPYRGFHVFMRALPEILKRRPKAQVVIVGGDGVSYGSKPRDGRTWRETLLAELGAKLDLSRIHFLGQAPYATCLKVLQVSSAHVYLTYPFALSRSMLEAMAAGGVVIASATAPVREVIRDGENGFLVDFFDAQAIADKVAATLADPRSLTGLRKHTRRSIIAQYDRATLCLPRQVRMVERLIAGVSNAEINEVTNGSTTPDPDPAARPRYPGLTAKESEVMVWLSRGKNAGEVAQILGRSEHTVKNQMRSIYGKLGVRNRVGALQRTNEFARAE